VLLGHTATDTPRTLLTIHTDEDTTETVTLRHPGTNDPTPLLTIAGAAFSTADWSRIESASGKLRDGQRASAWVCESGDAIVDWTAPKAGAPGKAPPPV